MKKPELLMPAGDLEKLKFAFAFGADAVYAGLPLYSLRAVRNGFTLETLKEGIEYAHGLGKKVYLTVNIFAHNVKLKPFIQYMKEQVALKPDAFIMSDPGLIMLAKQNFSEIEIHLSVQANNTNWAQIKFWHSQGIKRVILSRELKLEEIHEIHEQVPEIELESFVHGAICIAYSGRCLMSNYFNSRDPNQGTCTNSCRWNYKMHEEKYYLEEPERPGELMEISEDEHGTYIMNSKDLCAIEHVQDLIDAGVISFKVEGRSKTIYYASIVAAAYRQAIDHLAQGKNYNAEALLQELRSTTNRGFIPGFLPGRPEFASENMKQSNEKSTHLFAGKTVGYENGWAIIEPRNRIELGTELEFIQPDRRFKIQVTQILNEKNQPIEYAQHGIGLIKIQIPEPLGEFCIVRMPYREIKKVNPTTPQASVVTK